MGDRASDHPSTTNTSHLDHNHELPPFADGGTRVTLAIGEGSTANDSPRTETRAEDVRTTGADSQGAGVAPLPTERNSSHQRQAVGAGASSASVHRVVDARIKQDNESFRSDVIHSDVQAVAIDVQPTLGMDIHTSGDPADGDSHATGAPTTPAVTPATPVTVIQTGENAATLQEESSRATPLSSTRHSAATSDGVEFPHVAQRVYMDADLRPLEVEHSRTPPVVRVLPQSLPTADGNSTPPVQSPPSGCCQSKLRWTLFVVIAAVIVVVAILMSTVGSVLEGFRDEFDDDEDEDVDNDDMFADVENVFRWDASNLGYPDPMGTTGPTEVFSDILECELYCREELAYEGFENDLLAFGFVSQTTNQTGTNTAAIMDGETIGDCYCYYQLRCMIEDSGRDGLVFSSQPPEVLLACDDA